MPYYYELPHGITMSFDTITWWPKIRATDVMNSPLACCGVSPQKNTPFLRLPQTYQCILVTDTACSVSTTIPTPLFWKQRSKRLLWIAQKPQHALSLCPSSRLFMSMHTAVYVRRHEYIWTSRRVCMCFEPSMYEPRTVKYVVTTIFYISYTLLNNITIKTLQQHIPSRHKIGRASCRERM